MATIPTPIGGGYFDDALFDDFNDGWDVDVNTYLQLGTIRRFEMVTPGVFRRVDE